MAKMTMVQAINLALQQEMANDERVIVLGEDVGVDGGVFRVTEGLIEEFGDQRVIDTPWLNLVLWGCRWGWRFTASGRSRRCSFQGFPILLFISWNPMQPG